jgi:hypothetical protein
MLKISGITSKCALINAIAISFFSKNADQLFYKNWINFRIYFDFNL